MMIITRMMTLAEMGMKWKWVENDNCHVEKLDMILKSFQFDTIQFHKDVRMKSPKLSADQ